MSILPRYLKPYILDDLEAKMVFLGGPRQVGKTTFSQHLLPKNQVGYYNWDFTSDKQKILQGKWPSSQKLIVLDEIHKFAKWRGLIKGYFDTLKKTHQFLVTGSARLDYYRKSGDSLLGRYHYYRMHPFTLSEVGHEHLKSLLKFGGFPECFIEQNERNLKRWHLERRERIIYSDIRDLEHVKEISMIEVLADALPDRVGAPLSRQNLAQDIEVDFKTVEKWISILENVYYCYRILPFGAPKIKAVKKEQKLYLWDWSELNDAGKKWENFVASHLLKYCHFHQDVNGEQMELRFLRDELKREVDFVVLKNKKPLFAVECKTGEKKISPHLKYFAERTPIPIFYQVHTGKSSYSITDKIKVLPFQEFCKKENLL
jgi:predicted AAA+ superfamily ATPase